MSNDDNNNTAAKTWRWADILRAAAKSPKHNVWGNYMVVLWDHSTQSPIFTAEKIGSRRRLVFMSEGDRWTADSDYTMKDLAKDMELMDD